MNNLNAGLFERRHILLRTAPGRFHNFYALGDNRLDIARIIGVGKARQECQINADRLVRHVFATRDFIGKVFRCFLGQTGDDAEPASIGNSRRHFRETDIMHTALNDGVLNAEKFCNTRFHFSLP